MDRQTPSFLGLPREIRDEVYKYLLLFEPTPKTTSLTPLARAMLMAQRDKPVFRKPVSVQNAILCVNKQIHDEAAEIFYGFNTFAVRIKSVNHSGFQDYRHPRFQRFNLIYIAPWESLTFDCRAKSPWEDPAGEWGNGLGIRQSEGTRLPFESENEGVRTNIPWGYSYSETIDDSFEKSIHPIKLLNAYEARTLKLPAIRYRHLIRRIELDIESQFPQLEASNELCYSTEYLRLMLLPALNRLENSLEDGGRNVEVEVKVSGLIFEVDWEKGAASFLRAGDSERALHIKKQLEKKMYTTLCRFLWPLTTMRWKSSPISTQLDSQYPGVMEKEFERCRTFRGQFGGNLEQNFKSHEIPEEIVSVYVVHMWALVGGRLGVLATDWCIRVGLVPDVVIFEPENETVYRELGLLG
ncbi:hypothetical protein TWF225_004217 [Orbilia oligospora]|uniref:Uncharacterized protein n=1 Tax=Orbilia oligospora TaxID=2813651 RepID=A0A7C8PLB7_ORBOL|nr:hypothetical protein TWF751_006712 [Orbilia oligospora]KAF3187511.1 hypothetical protein TWF225_004217 [Orbilia oligospora]KAF3245162.1 hypothetical protein TWF128_009553 [Orbilia oligospora]KAF3272811.1 hypothetical protein TWF217_000272 [Orbilia oligospora]TGJ64779.1 hypothetical protein EYR41_010814 [Orbilia oligospora]